MIHVLDLLKQAGISKIAFGVTPVAPEPGVLRHLPFRGNSFRLATQEDPLSRIYDFDSRSMGRGIIIGLLGALCVHAAGATEASHLADSMGGWALDTRSRVHGYLAHLYDVELVEAPPPPPPPPEEPAPEPEAPKPAPAAAKTAPTEKAPPPPPRKREPS